MTPARGPVQLDLSAFDTRERLIRAALHLFQARGYHAVGLTEILKLAACPKGSLYHHFPGGKSALGVAVIHWLRDEIRDHFARAEARALPARKLVARLFSGTGDWLEASNWRHGALLAVMAQELVPSDPDLSAAIRHAYASGSAAFTRALVAGGLAEPQASQMADTVLAMLDGAIPRARTEDNARLFALLAQQAD